MIKEPKKRRARRLDELLRIHEKHLRAINVQEDPDATKEILVWWKAPDGLWVYALYSEGMLVLTFEPTCSKRPCYVVRRLRPGENTLTRLGHADSLAGAQSIGLDYVQSIIHVAGEMKPLWRQGANVVR
jgi:hypothetical protein